MFAEMEAARAEALHVKPGPCGLKAILAIHSSRLGPALGGCRYGHYSNEQHALDDALRLSEALSYKAALAGLPYGGGKLVLIRPAHVANRAQLFAAVGDFIESLGGRYIAAVGNGTSTLDMDNLAQQTGFVTSTSGLGDPAPYTALGVLAGIRATALARLGTDDLQGLRVSVLGLGQVGLNVAELLHAEGAELYVSDIDAGKMQQAADTFNARTVAPYQLISHPCDLFVPCSHGHILNTTTVPELRCAAVAGAANNQLQSPEIAKLLESRGILYAPDIVISAGGLIHVALTYEGYAPEQTRSELARIATRLKEIFAIAQVDKRSPAEVACELAQRILYD